MFARIYFCGSAIFCVLRELIFAIRTDWFFFLGIIFCIFQKVPVPSFDNIFVFNGYVQYKYIFSNNKPVSCCFWQAVIEQTRFLITVFLCGEFKLENIYSGVIFICGNLFLRIAEETAKLRTRKNFVPYSID